MRVSHSEIVCIRCFKQMDAASLPSHLDPGKDFISPGKSVAEDAVMLWCTARAAIVFSRSINVHKRLAVLSQPHFTLMEKDYFAGRSGSGIRGEGSQTSDLMFTAKPRNCASICCHGPSVNFAQSAIV